MRYEKDVSHCSKSQYVKEVTIKEVLPVPKADALDVVRFKEAGWQVVVKRGTVKVGDKHLFIPPESVLPTELSDALGVTKYLNKGKVKVVKIRGEFSEGLLADEAVCRPYLDYILHWEDVPTVCMRGTAEAKSVINDDHIPVFYKIPNLLNEPETFTVGDRVYVSEKIHGTNCRFGYLRGVSSRRHQLFVGSHKVVLKDPEYQPTFFEKVKSLLSGKKQQSKGVPNIYWTTVRRTLNGKLPPKDIVFYGEIYGAGVQDLDYEVPKSELKLRIFATAEHGVYHSFDKTIELCKTMGLETVPAEEYVYKDIEDAISLSQQPSVLTKKHIREGVVLRGIDEPRKWAKVVSPEYLSRRGKTTERH